MSDYDFSTLNDKDFEKLARDLLNAKFNLELQSFKVGKDKGIDLRYSTSQNNNSIVVQAKHFIGSGYAQLKHTLKTKELDKVKKLNPDRYIVVTSLPLSGKEKDEIKELMTPYVRNANDVIGQEDLNNYLNEFGEIEKRNFKLWFSSVNVFNSIINNAVERRTQFLLEEIQHKIPFYVVTKKLDEANRILDREKILLITGQPGIGKTTLAEIILFERAKDGSRIYKVENIREAEDVISPNKEEKQLFYFDDFLGANYLEILNKNNTETQLTSFVEQVRKTPNKYLVLTTRTVILNHAIDQFEKMSRSKLANEQFEIKLTDYTKYEKALILYNHLFFRNVKEELYNSILNKKFYKYIITHENYSPRIIEFITERSKIDGFSASDYCQFIKNNLDNPKEIWRHSFNNQIDYFDRCLLLTLFTFYRVATEKVLAEAFDKRLKYEKEAHNQVINSNQFNESTKILLNGFVISILRNIQKSEREYSFINPSLTDFLINYVAESTSEKKSIISSIVKFEQLNRFAPATSPISIERDLQIIIRDKFANSEIAFPLNWNTQPNKNYAATLKALCEYCKDVDIDSIVLDYFLKIDFEEDHWAISDDLNYVIWNLRNSPLTFQFIKKNFTKIIEIIIIGTFDETNAKKLPELFDKYNQDFIAYQSSKEGCCKLDELIEQVVGSIEEQYKQDYKDKVVDIYDVEDFYEELKFRENQLCNELLLFPQSYYSSYAMDQYYWNKKVKENLLENPKNDSFSDDNYQDHYQDIEYTEDIEIDDLFLKQE